MECQKICQLERQMECQTICQLECKLNPFRGLEGAGTGGAVGAAAACLGGCSGWLDTPLQSQGYKG